MEFLKKLNIKFKVILGVIASIIGFFLFIFIEKKISAADKLKYELESVKKEIEIEKTKEKTQEKLKEIKELEKSAEMIRKKIETLEEFQSYEGKEVPVEELDDFFKGRGF